MGFGNSEQNFGIIASKFTVAMWYTHPPPAACRLFSRGVIFTPARVSLALLSLRKNGGLLVVYSFFCHPPH